MKNKIICLLLALIMCLSSIFVLAACNKGGDDTNDDKTNTDDNKNDDNKEDNKDDDDEGGNKRPGGGFGDGVHIDDEWWTNISYETTELIMELNICSNDQELPSGLERYLAGETADDQAIDDLVTKRNEAAYANTCVTVKYVPTSEEDTAKYGFSKNIDRIYDEVSHRNRSTPDIYCNYMTDMLCTSLNGSFANLYSTKHGTGDYYGDNYFRTKDPGYMADLMSSLTLNLDKIYVIASDYFIDLIRAFFVVPVSVNLYNSVAKGIVKDYNNDNKYDINDFFYEVEAKEWNYDKVATYAAAVYRQGANNTSGQAQIGDQLGFVLAQNGLPAAAMVYTSSVVIIERDLEKQEFNYPAENKDLVALTDKLSWLFKRQGVMCVTEEDAKVYGEKTPLLGVRNRFTNNKILFGGVILVGSLEYQTYQDMRKGSSGGFGVVPVPTYRKGDDYLTQIHVVGRAGGIAYSTTKFVQCSAFLQYQSENSTKILNDYYDYNLSYDAAAGVDGNVTMLQYIRNNVRTSFDKLFEDAIGFFYEDTQKGSESNRWHTLIQNDEHRYQMDGMADTYDSLVDQKQKNLQDLIKQYEKLPE